MIQESFKILVGFLFILVAWWALLRVGSTAVFHTWFRLKKYYEGGSNGINGRTKKGTL